MPIIINQSINQLIIQYPLIENEPLINSQVEVYKEQHYKLRDRHTSAQMIFKAAERWLAVRLDTIVTFIGFFAVLICIYLRDGITTCNGSCFPNTCNLASNISLDLEIYNNNIRSLVRTKSNN